MKKSAARVLLASHGTEGAQAAEDAALEMCAEGAMIKHIVVVPTFWKGMMGDDWLNNGISRDRFARHLESELGKEVDNTRARVRRKAENLNLQYSSVIVLGEPDKCLVEASNEAAYDLVVMGSPRPKGKPGLRSRMATKFLNKKLTSPVMVVPYPNEC